MMSLRLWRILQHPSPNALLLLRKNHTSKQPKLNQSFLPALGYVLIATFFIVALIINNLVEFLWIVTIVLGFVSFAVYISIVFMNTFENLRCAIVVSGALAQIRSQVLGELLAVTSGGAIQLYWGFYASYVHDKNRFNLLIHERNTIYKMMLLTATLLILTSMIDPSSELSADQMLLIATITIFGLSFLQLDTIQSTILAGVMSMLIPTYITRRLEANTFAAVIFLGTQMIVYMLAVLTMIVITNVLNIYLSRPLPILSLSLILALILAFLSILREIIIWGLFTLLLHRLNTSLTDLNMLTTKAASL